MPFLDASTTRAVRELGYAWQKGYDATPPHRFASFVRTRRRWRL
jgi:hypothetical protein